MPFVVNRTFNATPTERLQQEASQRRQQFWMRTSNTGSTVGTSAFLPHCRQLDYDFFKKEKL